MACVKIGSGGPQRTESLKRELANVLLIPDLPVEGNRLNEFYNEND